MASFASTGLSHFSSLVQEAYTEYLRSVHYISQVLLGEAETPEGTALSLTAIPMLGRFWTPSPLVVPGLGVSYVLPTWS